MSAAESRRFHMKWIETKINLYSAYLRSTIGWKRHKELLKAVNTYCMFIGYPRSGHSLVGSLLTAHPNMVIAHELNALHYVQNGFSKNQLFYLILEKDRNFTTQGRKYTGYTYQVPNQWQGSYDELLVIGDKMGGASTVRLRRSPELLDRIFEMMLPLDIRFVHVIRNPYDNITTIMQKSNRDLEQAVEAYFKNCKTIHEIKCRIGGKYIYDLRLENLISNPQSSLRQLCCFLGVNCTEEYLKDCASIVFPSPKQRRYSIYWPDKIIKDVKSRIASFDFLDGYEFG